MQTLDPAGEWLRLSEHYRQLTDDELVDLARETSELTDVAQQALAQEIANRRLKVPPDGSPAPRSPEPQPDSAEDGQSPYAEDRELVVIRTVWSLGDALKLEEVLLGDESFQQICVAGKRCCPPEDCGGPQGFAELLKALRNANDPSHEEVCAWLGDFVPESFSADETNRRLRRRRKH